MKSEDLKMKNIEKLQKVIELHEEVKQRHWNWGMKACDYRSKYEEEHSMITELKHNDKEYKIVQQTSITRKYTYYDLEIYENGVRIQKDIRFIKKMLKEEVA